MPSLTTELKQRRPFESASQEAHLSVLRTASLLERGLVETLRPYGITPTQYNVLRILRGAPAEGLPCSDIGSRMITHEPDVTRLLDRLQKMGFTQRERASSDRRVVLTHITPLGRQIVDRLDRPIRELHERQLAALGPDDHRTLIRLLEAVRSSAAGSAVPSDVDVGAAALAAGD
jgi:DNA-binding MarR family transcriptional regulator